MHNRKPTSHDVARLAGVSQTTVSYVMSGRRSVAPETERRVQEAMERLGYQPNSGARALRSNRSHVLGVVVPHLAGADPASQHDLLISLAAQARSHDYDILLVTANEGPSGLQRVIDTALCDGIFIMEVLRQDPRADLVAHSGTPAVFIGIPDDANALVAVDADYELAARDAVTLLASRGHRSLTLLRPAHDSLANLNFIERFRSGVHAAARVSKIELREHGVGAASFDHVLRDIVTLAPHPGDALLLAPVVPADNWCNALRAQGLVPGKDISLISSSWDATHSHSLDQPVHFDMRVDELTRTAVELLLNRIDSRPPRSPEHHLIAPRLVAGTTLLGKA